MRHALAGVLVGALVSPADLGQTYHVDVQQPSRELPRVPTQNSMFPVDANIVERMNSYGRRTLDVIAELADYGVATKRLMPKLLWVVQYFNLYNLRNSHISVREMRVPDVASHACPCASVYVSPLCACARVPHSASAVLGALA